MINFKDSKFTFALLNQGYNGSLQSPNFEEVRHLHTSLKKHGFKKGNRDKNNQKAFATVINAYITMKYMFKISRFTIRYEVSRSAIPKLIPGLPIVHFIPA